MPFTSMTPACCGSSPTAASAPTIRGTTDSRASCAAAGCTASFRWAPGSSATARAAWCSWTPRTARSCNGNTLPATAPPCSNPTEKSIWWGGLPGKRSALLRYDRDLNLCDSAALPRATEFRSSCRDTLGRIWFGLQQGIFVLDPETRQAAADPALTRCANRMSGHCVTMLFPDRSGTVHIGTQGSNIHMFNVPNGVAEYNIAYRFHLSHTSDFRCGFSDSENNIWIGTGDRGYAVRHSQRKNFNSASRLARLTQGKYINAVSARKDGTLWIGSRYKGLLAYNPDAPALWYTVSNCDFMSRIASNGIESLHTGSDERLWININDRIVVCTTDRSRITGHTLLANAPRSTGSAKTPANGCGPRPKRAFSYGRTTLLRAGSSPAATCRTSSRSTATDCWPPYRAGASSPSARAISAAASTSSRPTA